MASKVRAPAGNRNRTKGPKETKPARAGKAATRAPTKRTKDTNAEPDEARAAPPPATPSPRDGLPDHSPVEALPVAHLLRVDRWFADEAVVAWFRERYPARAAKGSSLYRPTNEELRRARAIVEEIGVALIFGGQSKWEQVSRAYEVLFATDTKARKIAACVSAIRNAVKHFRDPRHLNVAEGLVDALARYEPAFANLKTHQVRIELERTRPHEAVRKGGAGNMGPLGLAAILVLSVGAFDVEPSADPQKVKSLLDVAVRRAKRAQKPPRDP